MPTALVTGAAGFIGSHVAERFLSEGWTVHIVDNLVSEKRENLPAAATFHELDIRSAEAAALVTSVTPDVLVHLAAQMDVRRSVTDPVFDAKTNVVGSLNLLEAVRASSPRTRVVFASTGGAVYGDFTTPPNVETFEKDPESPYAISKLAVELYLAYYGRVHGLEAVALRFGNVYGPRQDPHGEAGVVAIFLEKMLRGAAPVINGDGLQTRDYVHVRDVARINCLAVESASARGAFNVGTARETTVVDLAAALAAHARYGGRIEHGVAKAGEQRRSVIDPSAAHSAFGWAPEIDLEAGLRDTARWFAETQKGRE